MEICGEEFCGISWNSVEFRGISWNFVEFRGISWNFVEFRGISWNFVGFRGISWFLFLGRDFFVWKGGFVDKNLVEFRGIFYWQIWPFFGPKKAFFQPKMFVEFRGISWNFVGFRGISWDFVFDLKKSNCVGLAPKSSKFQVQHEIQEFLRTPQDSVKFRETPWSSSNLHETSRNPCKSTKFASLFTKCHEILEFLQVPWTDCRLCKQKTLSDQDLASQFFKVRYKDARDFRTRYMIIYIYMCSPKWHFGKESGPHTSSTRAWRFNDIWGTWKTNCENTEENQGIQTWTKLKQICFWTIFGNHTRTIKKNDPKLTTQPCQSEQFWMQTTIQKFLYISTCPGFLDESTMLKLISWETSQAAMKMVLASICNLQHRDSSGHFGPF